MNTKDLIYALRSRPLSRGSNVTLEHEAADALERLEAENEALRRGECICKRCGLRQPGENAGPVLF